MSAINIYELTLEELEQLLEKNNFNRFAANQIFNWLYKKYESDFDQMTNLSKELSFFLKQNFTSNLLVDLVINKSEDGTIKFLFVLDDKKTIETTVIKQKHGFSICISTQVGCKMGCDFCASGLLKTERNLTTSEMVRQIITVNRYLQQNYEGNDIVNLNISSVVVMGIGEPFDNFDNLIKFIQVINHKKGLSIGARHITISTCGIAPKIKEFADLKTQVNLAISLHAPNNEIRNKIMPINKIYPLETLIESILYYTSVAKRRITIEYILLDKINDSEQEALELISLIKNINCYINLIPYNQVEENDYKRSTNIKSFFKTLKNANVNAILRKGYGADIDAACGQLRAKREGAN